jgi:hypothetical protein
MATNISRPFSMDNFFKVATDPSGKDILDPYTFYWTDFPYFLRNSDGLAIRVDVSLEGVPDLISWAVYESHDYWWIVCIANEMVVPDVEITPGINMFIPNAGDIANFNSQLTARVQVGRLVSLRFGAQFVTSSASPPPTSPPPTSPLPGIFTLGKSKLGGPDVLG